MADAKKTEAAEGEAPAKPKSKKLLIIIIAVVVLVLAAGAGAFLMLKGKKADAEAEDGEETSVQDKKAKKDKKDPKKDAPPVFVKLDPPFTVKLQSEQQDSYLQVSAELRVLDLAVGEKIKQYMPEIRFKVLLILQGKKPQEMNNPAEVQKLALQLRDTINNIIEPAPPPKKGQKAKAAEEAAEAADPDAPVQAVLFTSLIVQ